MMVKAILQINSETRSKFYSPKKREKLVKPIVTRRSSRVGELTFARF